MLIQNESIWSLMKEIIQTKLWPSNLQPLFPQGLFSAMCGVERYEYVWLFLNKLYSRLYGWSTIASPGYGTVIVQIQEVTKKGLRTEYCAANSNVWSSQPCTWACRASIPLLPVLLSVIISNQEPRNSFKTLVRVGVLWWPLSCFLSKMWPLAKQHIRTHNSRKVLSCLRALLVNLISIHEDNLD